MKVEVRLDKVEKKVDTLKKKIDALDKKIDTVAESCAAHRADTEVHRGYKASERE
jgi:phage shock protein A